MSGKRKDEKLRAALSDEVARLRAEAEESYVHRVAVQGGASARERAAPRVAAVLAREVAKLRDILKQAVRDSKEALEEVRGENAVLRAMLGDKDTAVKRTKQELECLRISEAAARDSVKELQSMLVATAASPTAAAAGKPEPEESPSPRVRVGPPGLEKYPSDSKIRPPAGVTRPRRMSETFEGSAYDIFGSMDEQKGGDLGVFSGMPRLPGRRRVVLRKVGSLFRWKSFTNK